MSASTNFSSGAASTPMNPTVIHDADLIHAAAQPGGAEHRGGTSDTAFASILAGAAFESVPPTSEQAGHPTTLIRYRRDGDSPAAGARNTAMRCHYPVRPVNNVTPDADGRIRGADLKGTQTYERLVHALSVDTRHPSRTPSAAKIASAEAAVNGMKLPLGSTVVAPCHEGHDAGDRPVGRSAPASTTTPAARTRRAVPEGIAAAMNNGAAPTTSAGNQPNIEPVPEQAGTAILRGIVDPCRPIGLWQRVFDAIARFIGPYLHPSTNGDAPSTSDSKRADACPAKREMTEEDIRNYDNYLLAWSTSFTRRRRADA
ncbi:hypothetical protein BOSP111201_04190 [Bordetella sputigena]|uniref:hypothetical protein n=1 Tax=Bordetella sputigena TaxID=1416810 RepID=UPI0039EF3A5C